LGMAIAVGQLRVPTMLLSQAPDGRAAALGLPLGLEAGPLGLDLIGPILGRAGTPLAPQVTGFSAALGHVVKGLPNRDPRAIVVGRNPFQHLAEAIGFELGRLFLLICM